MSEYVPTTEQVRGAWLDIGMQFGRGGADAHMAAFDRWLAAHDRQVKAEAWDEAVDWLDAGNNYEVSGGAHVIESRETP